MSAPECEFFLFHTDDDGRPTTVTHEQEDILMATIDLGENARRDMILTLEDMGFEIISHHEIAPAQHEIDFHYDEAMITADNLMTFKMVVKTIANDTVCTRHLCQSRRVRLMGQECTLICLYIKTMEQNALYNAEDENGLSQEGYYFIGGLMKHMKAITCITNPTINSYKRFVPGYEAPVYMGWSAKTRGFPDSCVYGERRQFKTGTSQSGCYGESISGACSTFESRVDGIKNQIMPRRILMKIFRR